MKGSSKPLLHFLLNMASNKDFLVLTLHSKMDELSANLDIVETGLTLLTTASMPLKFWSYAFQIAQSSHFQTLFQRSPDYHSFKVFGCLCYPHLRPYNSNKLIPRSTQCVFIGYSRLHKGHLCLHPNSGQVYITRHIVFDELAFPFSTAST